MTELVPECVLKSAKASFIMLSCSYFLKLYITIHVKSCVRVAFWTRCLHVTLVTWLPSLGGEGHRVNISCHRWRCLPKQIHQIKKLLQYQMQFKGRTFRLTGARSMSVRRKDRRTDNKEVIPRCHPAYLGDILQVFLGKQFWFSFWPLETRQLKWNTYWIIQV